MLTIENAGPEHQELIERLSALVDLEKNTLREMRDEAHRRGWTEILDEVMSDLNPGGPRAVTSVVTVRYEQQVEPHHLRAIPDMGMRSGTVSFVRTVPVKILTDLTTCQCANVTDRMVRLALWDLGVIADGPIEITHRSCRAQGGHIR